MIKWKASTHSESSQRHEYVFINRIDLFVTVIYQHQSLVPRECQHLIVSQFLWILNNCCMSLLNIPHLKGKDLAKKKKVTTYGR